MTAVTAPPLDWDGYTIADLEAMPDDEFLRYELDDGCLVVSPPPPNPHSMASTELAFVLHAALDREYRILVEGSLLFDERNYRQPDLLVIRRAAGRRAYAAPPDVLLAVEVMSPSSKRRDRLIKPAQYAAAGIQYFWRLEPADRVLITYVLDGESYRESGRFTDEDEVEIDEPVSLRFPLTQLLD